jgi:hypothetical protein
VLKEYSAQTCEKTDSTYITGLDPEEMLLDRFETVAPVAIMPLDGHKPVLRLRKKLFVLCDGSARETCRHAMHAALVRAAHDA